MEHASSSSENKKLRVVQVQEEAQLFPFTTNWWEVFPFYCTPLYSVYLFTIVIKRWVERRNRPLTNNQTRIQRRRMFPLNTKGNLCGWQTRNVKRDSVIITSKSGYRLNQGFVSSCLITPKTMIHTHTKLPSYTNNKDPLIEHRSSWEPLIKKFTYQVAMRHT